DAAGGGGAGAYRVGGRGGVPRVLLVACPARAASGARAASRGQLRQRLQRRGARHRRGGPPGRADAAGRIGRGGAPRGEARRVRQLLPGVLPRARARGGDLVVDRGPGGALRARRLVLHRRVAPLRVPGARGGVRLRVLRRGGGRRDRVRADGPALVAGPGGVGARGPAVVRAADGQ